MPEQVADVLIIGAGASAGVAARRLAAAGLRVVCLEQGDWPDRNTYPGATAEWELAAAKQWSSLPSVRQAPADYPIDVSESDLGVINFNGVGGGMVLYAAQWPRMLPGDFRVASTDGVADDWPLTYDELAPYYEQTEREFGISGLGGNPLYPPGADPPLPPLPIGAAGLLVARAHARLGWHWWPQYNAILSAAYDGRHPCVQRGTCGSGCNEGAKASTDITHFPRVVAEGGQVITGARVQRILTDPGGVATGAEWVDRSGAEHVCLAEVVLCAANAIGSARLLLASAGPGHPDGLANSSGLVGRRLMLHPLSQVTGLFDQPLEGWRGQAGGLIQCQEFAGSDPDRGFVRGAIWELGTSGGPMRAAFAPDGRGCWGAGHHRHVRERLGRSAAWAILCEDLPEEHNRVELSPTLTDGSGLAAPKVVYRLSDNSRRLTAWQVERAAESLRAAGAWDIDARTDIPNGHLMGTARMGDDPRTSVVDRWCMSHDVPNLGIIDGSVFVTAGAANPTSTIAALALRAADHLVAHRHRLPAPRRRTTFAGFARPARTGTAASDERGDPAAGRGGEPDGSGDPDDGRAGSPAPVSPGPPWSGRPISASGRTLVPDLLRSRFQQVADLLIPAADGMPGAASVGVGSSLLDRVLRVRPDLVPGLLAALDRIGDDPRAGLEALRASDRAGFRAVSYVAAGAYYLDDGVRAALGYPGTVGWPVRALDFPEYLAEGLLDHLTGSDA